MNGIQTAIQIYYERTTVKRENYYLDPSHSTGTRERNSKRTVEIVVWFAFLTKCYYQLWKYLHRWNNVKTEGNRRDCV